MSETAFQNHLKNKSRGYSRDMSAEAIARRLDVVEEMNRACDELGKAKFLGRVEELEKKKDVPES